MFVQNQGKEHSNMNYLGKIGGEPASEYWDLIFSDLLHRVNNIVISKLDPNQKITLSDLTLPINTPIQVEVDWLVGSTIKRETGTFQITESK